MDEPNTNTNAISRTIALPADLWDQIDQLVAKRHGGKRSAYFRLLVEGDLTGIDEHGIPRSRVTNAMIGAIANLSALDDGAIDRLAVRVAETLEARMKRKPRGKRGA